MYKKPLIRVMFCIILILLTRNFIINGLDKINVLATNYLNAVDNEISIDENFDSIYVISDLKNNNSELNFNIKSDDNEYVLLVSSLTFYHEIYLNNKLYSQNIDENKKKYNPNFAYKTLEIKDISNIRIIGDKLEKLEFFVAKKNIMDDAIEKKQYVIH